MRTQLKYLKGIQFLHDKLEDSKFTTFFEPDDNEIKVVTPTSGSTVYILGIVAQNLDAIRIGTVRVSVRIEAPNEDRGEQLIDTIEIQPKQILVRYYPSLRIFGNNTRTFNVDLRGASSNMSLSCWFYTENTTNEKDSNRDS